MTVMNRLLTILVCVLPFLAAGCFGDSIAHRAVVLDFPASQQQTNLVLSVTDPEIQEALRIIDGVFATNGFARDKNPPAPQDQAQGIVATYGRYAVSIKGHSLIVSFVEFGKRHSSPIVKKTCSLMEEKLSNRFGAQRVSVETDTDQMQVK